MRKYFVYQAITSKAPSFAQSGLRADEAVIMLYNVMQTKTTIHCNNVINRWTNACMKILQHNGQAWLKSNTYGVF